ncbi:YbaK/EbsC family protein [Streptomyces sp. DSM 41982]|uniref:YbaK/EbsC family protein n=1 Tax=Streptomyces evansiae TaxID=3075535 RepID=A0ABD5EBU1_9ACTN|nr:MULTISPECIES: YbaK/EbsC family protein [unclassified Streptomyces]MDT0417705.1 YbaK/EbsC family protein [Streptomyces sp. DSM 41982]SCE05104.1 Cys-tRNA(Pro) deacylase, prolyl-tRNA editing enzyme YbaK/EbsC [Streptomyces sp. SolWspMP-sol7th]
MRAPLGNFTDVRTAPEALDVLVEPVARAVRHWAGPVPAEEVYWVDSDPEVADTAAFVAHYGRELLEASANCVIVTGRRGEARRHAACLVLSHTRVDVNGVVRKQLDARKASFAATDFATGESGMEYGGITPVGLPDDWPLLIDAAVTDLPYVLVGSGRRRGKLLVPGKAFAQLAGAVVVEGLGVAVD